MIYIRGLKKSFGALKVLNGIDLTVSNGEVLLAGNTNSSWNDTIVTSRMLATNSNAASILAGGGQAQSVGSTAPGYLSNGLAGTCITSKGANTSGGDEALSITGADITIIGDAFLLSMESAEVELLEGEITSLIVDGTVDSEVGVVAGAV